MWKPIIDSLLGSGLTLREISERTGIPASTISELRSGITIDPRWSTGDRLRQLHEEIVGPAPDQREAA